VVCYKSSKPLPLGRQDCRNQKLSAASSTIVTGTKAAHALRLASLMLTGDMTHLLAGEALLEAQVMV
jgi:hypothetical protein